MFAGNVTVRYRAWDQTSGTSGQYLNSSTNGGSSAFSSGTGTATLSVSNTTATAWLSLRTPHHALSFNGSTAYLESGSALANALNTFTVAMWIKPNALSGRQDLLGQRGAVDIYLDGSDVCIYTSGSGRGTECTSMASYLTVGAWSHLVVVGDAGRGTLKVYLDGVLRATHSGSSHASFGSSSNPWRVAGFVSDTSAGNYLYGDMDEISLWNAAYDSTAVAALAHYHPNGTEPYLVAYWALDDASGIVY
ncbi:MAG: LamG domain-containing protein [Planctomycetota bacterium]